MSCFVPTFMHIGVVSVREGETIIRLYVYIVTDFPKGWHACLRPTLIHF